jgi:type I restriction enzyme S subunit
VYRLERGDILLNEGQSVKLVGRAAMYNGEVPGACFQNTLVRFRARPGLNARYALVVFLHYLHSERFRAIAKWSTNIAHISAGRLATMAFPLPPRPEQDRIVAEVDRRLSVADRELDAVRSVLARGASLRRTILLQAFTGRLVPQHEQDGSAVVEAMLFQRQARDRKAGASTSRMPRKPSGEQTMPIRRSLYDVLNDAGAPLTPESLLEQSGFSEESVDDFYEELKREVLRKRIVEIRAKGSNEIALKAAKP